MVSHSGSLALKSPRMYVLLSVLSCWMLSWKLLSVEEVGGMYMLTSVMFCFCMRSVVDWSSSVLVGSGGRDATVWAVVLVKGM